MATVTKVVISDALIIRSCNIEGGSGGVADWANRLSRKMVTFGQAIGPVGDPGDAGSRGFVVGTYKASFGWERGRRGTGHRVERRIYNSAPHAYYVEYGRAPALTSRKQVFTQGFVWRATHFTMGWEGQHVLARVHALGTSLVQ
jgi:hypothetical protein